MKTFKDLSFTQHRSWCLGTQAKINFDNGYGVSVITGDKAYTDVDCPYELAVLKDGNLCYSTPITDDVLGYLTKTKVTNIMKKVQSLEGVIK